MLAHLLPVNTRPTRNVDTTADRFVGCWPGCIVFAKTLDLLQVWSKGLLATCSATRQIMQTSASLAMTWMVLLDKTALEVIMAARTGFVDLLEPQVGRPL